MEKQVYKGNWICCVCGKAITELPFYPNDDRSINCSDCHTKAIRDRKSFFEILVTDIKGTTVIESTQNFCYSLLSNAKLWDEAKIVGDTITDEKKRIKVIVKKLNIQKDSDGTELKQAFTLTVEGIFDSLESFRVPLLQYLKMLKFDLLYVLEDDVSLIIAHQLYSSIYKVESFLRKYIIKFFAIKLGPEWWELTAGSDMKKKISLRKNNETVFSEYIDNEVYLIDFGELGKLIYSQSSGNLNKEDIIDKIIKAEETPVAIRKLKNEIQTNYNKFFKATFKEENFQNKWEELEKIRHKVAHNNLFTLEDRKKGGELVKSLIEIIRVANEKINKLSFSDRDKQHVMNSFLNFKKITEETLIDELKCSMEWTTKSADGFVGLQNFIINILGNKGYEFQWTRDLIKKLENEKRLEIYTYNSDKAEHGVAAIKLI